MGTLGTAAGERIEKGEGRRNALRGLMGYDSGLSQSGSLVRVPGGVLESGGELFYGS